MGKEVIDLIIENAQNGVDAHGKPFPKYTKAYEKLTGKKSVDLTLSEQMLDSLRIINTTEDEIKIGWKSMKQREKAEGNILGSYGREPDRKKARDFLHISKDDFERILKKFEDE